MSASGEIEELERRVASLVGRRHCIFVGRGTAAIYIALRALRKPPGKVVLPAVVCPSPANAVMYAGLDPVFCDVSLDDFNLAPAALESMLRRDRNIVAVMPVHLYGWTAAMDDICAVAQRYGVSVIEDAAQALGGTCRGRPLGGFGDVSILSFGHTKILDIGWGGAAVTDRDDLADLMRQERVQLPPCPANIDRMFEEYRRLYYALRSVADPGSRLEEMFLYVPELFRDMYLFNTEKAKASMVANRLGELASLVGARRANAERYRAGLGALGLHLPRADTEAAPWRYSFLIARKHVAALTSELRAAGIDASNWYPALYRWYRSGRAQDPGMFPNADRVAAEVVNLWVEPAVAPDRIDRTVDIIRQFLLRAASS